MSIAQHGRSFRDGATDLLNFDATRSKSLRSKTKKLYIFYGVVRHGLEMYGQFWVPVIEVSPPYLQ